MSFTSTDPQNHQGENTWFTPRRFIAILGPFDLDPCTVSFRPFDTAHRHIERDKGGCGLSFIWSGDVWLNPPYGRELMPFIDKFIAHRQGVMLIFARMGSEGVQKLLSAGANAYCLRQRVHFIHKDGVKKTNAGTDSMLVFFDEKYRAKVKTFEGVLICSDQSGAESKVHTDSARQHKCDGSSLCHHWV